MSSGGGKHRQTDPGSTAPERSRAAAGEDESASIREHRAEAPRAVATAVVTVSDTRTLEDDAGGGLIAELLEAAGHPVASRVIVKKLPW